MAYWGIAYALSPNINAPMSRDQERRAYEAVQKAKTKVAGVTPPERAYINALAVRYSITPDADRAALGCGLCREHATTAPARSDGCRCRDDVCRGADEYAAMGLLDT